MSTRRKPKPARDLKPKRKRRRICDNEDFLFTCTLPAGHRGDHVAHGIGGNVCFRWRQRKRRPSRREFMRVLGV